MCCLILWAGQCEKKQHSSNNNAALACVITVHSILQKIKEKNVLLLHLQTSCLHGLNNSIYHCQRFRTIRKASRTASNQKSQSCVGFVCSDGKDSCSKLCTAGEQVFNCNVTKSFWHCRELICNTTQPILSQKRVEMLPEMRGFHTAKNSGIVEDPKLEGTCKDHRVQLWTIKCVYMSTQHSDQSQ